MNGNKYSYVYDWLADGICGPYPCFLKTYFQPETRMQLFATAQDAKQKILGMDLEYFKQDFMCWLLDADCGAAKQQMKTVI